MTNTYALGAGASRSLPSHSASTPRTVSQNCALREELPFQHKPGDKPRYYIDVRIEVSPVASTRVDGEPGLRWQVGGPGSMKKARATNQSASVCPFVAVRVADLERKVLREAAKYEAEPEG